MNRLIRKTLVLVVGSASLSFVRWSGVAEFNIPDGDVAALESAILPARNNDDDISTWLQTAVTF